MSTYENGQAKAQQEIQNKMAAVRMWVENAQETYKGYLIKQEGGRFNVYDIKRARDPREADKVASSTSMDAAKKKVDRLP